MFGNIQIYIEKMFRNTKYFAKRMFGNTKFLIFIQALPPRVAPRVSKYTIFFSKFAATLPPWCVKCPVYGQNRVVADGWQVAANRAILPFFDSQSTQNRTLFRVFEG